MPAERNQVKKGTYGMTLSMWPCLGHASLGGGMGLLCVFLPSWHGFGGHSSSGKAPGRALSPYLGFRGSQVGQTHRINVIEILPTPGGGSQISECPRCPEFSLNSCLSPRLNEETNDTGMTAHRPR